MLRLVALLIAWKLVASSASSQAYTYPWYVVRVIDGDSLIIDVPEWPAPFRPSRVRVDGVNAPGSRRGRGEAKCEIERGLGKQVSARLREKLPKGTPVTLSGTASGRSTGGCSLRCSCQTGQDAAEAIVKAGYSVTITAAGAWVGAGTGDNERYNGGHFLIPIATAT